MPRSQTFGYNAAVGIDELVIDRLLKVKFEIGEIPEAFSDIITFQDWGGTTADVYVLIRDIGLSFDTNQELDQYVNLILSIQVVVNFSQTPPVPFLEDDLDFKATVTTPIKLTIDSITNEIRPDFNSIETESIYVSLEPGLNILLAGFIENELGTLVPDILNNLSVDFSLPILLDAENFLSDRFNVVLINDTSEKDTDSINILFYSSLDTSSKGNPGGVINFLREEKTFALKLSKAVFDEQMELYIDRRFARFNATIGKNPFNKNSVVFFPPDSSGKITVEGLKSYEHSGVEGYIENATRGGKTGFSASNDGTFKVTLTAEVGDVLNLRGDAIKLTGGGQSVRLNYKPTISLSDGYIKISCNGSTEVVGIDIDAEIDGKLYLNIDPVTGKIITDARDVDLDIPWWADILLGILTGPFAGLILGTYEDSIQDSIEAILGQYGSNLLPGFDKFQNIITFLEDVEIKKKSIIIYGQLEAGLIRSAGRNDKLSIYLDSNDSNTESQNIGIFKDSRYVYTDPGLAKQFAEYGIARLGKSRFEELSYDSLSKLNYAIDGITIPGTDTLAGEVFAVKTAWDRYAKVRIDSTKFAEPILRWVTYERKIGSEVKIKGSWNSDLKNTHTSDGMFWHMVSKFWGTFTLEFHRIFADGPLNISWTYGGVGNFKILTNDQRTVSLEVNTDDIPEEGFKEILKVDVEDVFGRKATESIVLVAYNSFGELGPNLERYVDLTELAIYLHGPGPVALPMSKDKLLIQYQSRIQLYQEALKQLMEPNVRLPNLATIKNYDDR